MAELVFVGSNTSFTSTVVTSGIHGPGVNNDNLVVGTGIVKADNLDTYTTGGSSDTLKIGETNADIVRIYQPTHLSTLDTAAGALNIGITTATAVGISRAGVTTTINGDAIVSGDLQVDGTTTTINSTVMTVDDNLVVFADGQAAGAKDIGFIGDRGDGLTLATSNIGLVFQEATKEIIAGYVTTASKDATTITLQTPTAGGTTSYLNYRMEGLHVGGGTGEDRDRDATITFHSGDGSTATADKFIRLNNYTGTSFRFEANQDFHVTGTLQSTGALTVDAGGGSIAGGLTLTTAGITMTGLDIGGAAAEIGDTYTDGFMRFGQSAANPNAGTRIDNKGFLYSKDAAGISELFWMDDDNPANIVQLTSNGLLNSSLQLAYNAGNTISVTANDRPVKIDKGATYTDGLRFANTMQLQFTDSFTSQWRMSTVAAVVGPPDYTASLYLLGADGPHATDAEAFRIETGSGIPSTSTTAGAGGNYYLNTGAGGDGQASSGRGGAGGHHITVLGKGGTGGGHADPGVGGSFTFTAGDAGSGSGQGVGLDAQGGGFLWGCGKGSTSLTGLHKLSGVGGDFIFQGGLGGPNLSADPGGTGGNFYVNVGANGTHGTEADGGASTLANGDGGDGGGVKIVAGTGGAGGGNAGGSGGDGGNITLEAGIGGTGNAAGASGSAELIGGAGTAASAVSGDSSVKGGSGLLNVPNPATPGDAYLLGGAVSGAGTGGTSGDAHMRGGSLGTSTAGTLGTVYVGDADTGAIQIGNTTDRPITSVYGHVKFEAFDNAVNNIGLQVPVYAAVPTSTAGTLETGDVVYDSAHDDLYAYTGAAWQKIGGATSPQTLQQTYELGNTIDVTGAIGPVTLGNGDNNNAMLFEDSVLLIFGTGTDLTVTHNGTNSVLTSITGDLIIDNISATGSTIIQLGNDTSATDFQVINNGGDSILTAFGDRNVQMPQNILAAGTAGFFAVSKTAGPPTGVGITEGSLAYNGDVLYYFASGGWTALGTAAGATLQSAYGVGNTITMTNARPFQINPAAGGDTAAISLNADAASNFTVAAANLTLATTTSGTVALNSAGTMTLNSDGAMSLATDVGAAAGPEIDLTAAAGAAGFAGGALDLNAGAGTSSTTGGAGGVVTINTGAGSDSTAADTAGAVGGDLDLTASAGGAATAGNADGGDAGDITLTTSAGGAGFGTGVAGDAGDIGFNPSANDTNSYRIVLGDPASSTTYLWWGSATPAAGSASGSMWIDQTTYKLKIWTGAAWIVVGQQQA